MQLLWRHLCRCRTKQRCLAGTIVLLLIWAAICWLDILTEEGDGFPHAEFAAHWNSSPHCTGWSARATRRIHLMYQSEHIPAVFAAYVRSWVRDYPHFQLHFWTDAGIDRFLLDQFGPHMLDFFRNRLAHGVERSDVARLLILNHFGGLYVDLDVMSLRSAEMIFEKYGLVFTEEPRPHAIFLYNQPSLISNAVVYSSPCHIFWLYYFRQFPVRLQTGFGGALSRSRRNWQRHLAVFATGPIALDSIAKSFLAIAGPSLASSILVAPPELFQPVFDAKSPGLSGLRWSCRLPLLLSGLQMGHCVQFLQRPHSFANTSQAEVAFAKHDFLHLGYHKARAVTVMVKEIAPEARLHS